MAAGQRATKQGDPPGVPSHGLCSPCQTPGTTWLHGLQEARCPGRQRKALPRPDHPVLGPQKRSGGVNHPPHDGGDVTAQAGSHQKNRREQKFASCSGLGFRILRVEAAAGRGRAALVMELLLEAPEGRLEAQTQRGRSSLRETEPPASGSGAPGSGWGCHLLRGSASGAWSRERWEQQDQGAARRTLPGATQV